MTTRDLHHRASELFLELRERTPEEQRSHLDQLGDAELKREVAELLEHDVPTQHSVGVNGARSGAAPRPVNSPSEAPRSGTESSDVPAAIGPYTILRRLGRGGSGYVLLAEQHQPIHRLVAIKIVPYAAVNPESAARFEFERRALERTDHPNIARILDAGKTADGLPYLVIEYVEGEPLSQYCRDKKLAVRDRIALILDIADAVQHAHQRGVIHRDLKPANILVSETSGRPIPRILDFGIAKPTESIGADALVTSGIPIGTPAFMAPEQTGGRVIDTRADIYALGAVLYTLIAGRPPIDTSGEPIEILRRIKESIPIAVSKARQRLLQGSTAGTGNLDLPPAEVIPRPFLYDLDCVLNKALEKDPAQRYESVSAFSEDLRRLLTREPILAHPPTFRYRAARFAQRHRALVVAVSIVALAVVLGLGGLTAGLIEANRQRREASFQTESQREINAFLTEDLLGEASPDREGEKITALELVTRASKRVEQRLQGRPLVAAVIHNTLGNTFAKLGDFRNAERHLNLALELRRAHAGPDAPDTVRSEIALASCLTRREVYDRAEPALRAAIERARLILGSEDPALYTALNDLGAIAFTLGRGKEAIGILQESLAGAIRVHGERSPFVLETTSNLAQAFDMAGDSARSLQLHLDALRIADSMPNAPRFTLIGLNNNIGATYQGMNRDQEAAPYIRRASELAAEWFLPDNPDRWILQGNLASLEAELGNADRGIELYKEVIENSARILGPDSYNVMSARHMYANTLWIAKRFDEAADAFKALLPDISRNLKSDNWLTIQTRSSLARTLFDGGRISEALPYAEQAAAEFRATLGADHPRTRNTTLLLNDIKSRLGR